MDPTISTEYTYKGIDAAFLENDHLRLLVLPGKGGDLIEFTDKRADVDVLWDSPHNWTPPERRYVPSEVSTTWHDHYPGGWQVNLPVAGFGMDIEGSAYGIHGESALLPFDATVVQDDGEAVSLRLSTELVRYPFYIERELTLPADAPRLEISESITNRGGVELEYMWQHHIAVGPPLLSPAARFDVPAATGIVEEYGEDYPNARLEDGLRFEWPHARNANGDEIDLREIPPRDVESHDIVYITDLQDGWYALTNRELDLGFGFTFPEDQFESVWYWQPFGGYQGSPFFNRNYNVGFEATTAYPSHSIPEAQRRNGTMKSLRPGETIDATFEATTYRGFESVSNISDGAVVEGEMIDNSAR